MDIFINQCPGQDIKRYPRYVQLNNRLCNQVLGPNILSFFVVVWLANISSKLTEIFYKYMVKPILYYIRTTVVVIISI